MGILGRWKQATLRRLQRDVEQHADDHDMPGGFRRELARLFEQELPPRAMRGEMDRLMDEFRTPRSMRNSVAQLFDELPGGGLRALGGRQVFVPSIEVIERESEYLMRVDLPGVVDRDIDVRVSPDNVLTITGERREEPMGRDRGFEYTERAYGSFARSIELPLGAETFQIETDFHNGVLEIRVPKAELARSRRIPVGPGMDRGQMDEPRIMAPGDGRMGQQNREGEGMSDGRFQEAERR